jgi:hypothetical protein
MNSSFFVGLVTVIAGRGLQPRPFGLYKSTKQF